jgi:hypothetical protein
MATSVKTYDDGAFQAWTDTDNLGNVTYRNVLWSQLNLATIQTQAATALANNRTFLGITSPTTAQAVTQVQALTHQNQGIIRLLLSQLDGTN